MNRIFLALGAVVALAGCQKTEVKEEAKAPFRLSDTMMQQIVLDTVRMRPVLSELTFSGQVVTNGDQTTKVSPLVGGVVEKLNVELGDHVTKGQVLAVIRSGEIADIQNQGSTAGTDLAIAQKNLAVAEDQFKAGLAAERDVVLARQELQKAQSNLGKTRKQLSVYGVLKDGYYSVTAPISGFITEKNVTQNMQYTAAGAESFFTIANLDQIWVMANVFESDIAKVHVGEDADVTTLAYPDKHFVGKIDKVFNVLDPDSKVLRVRVRLPNPGYALKPEMYAQVRLKDVDKAQMLEISAKAVVFDKDRNFVMVYRDRSHIETRPVEISKTVGDRSYIKSGLKPGDVVIAKEQLLVYDELND